MCIRDSSQCAWQAPVAPARGTARTSVCASLRNGTDALRVSARHQNILKRILLHAAALNLGLLMRTLFGVGTPRSLQGRAAAIFIAVYSFIRPSETFWMRLLGCIERHIARGLIPLSQCTSN